MNEFHKHRAASILACYSNADDIIEKAHPVGYINKNGYQKQADGSYKYLGKAAKLKAQEALANSTTGQPLYTVSKKPTSEQAYIKTPNGWEPIKDFFDRYKEGIPANIAKQISFNSANVPDFMESAIKVAVKTLTTDAVPEKKTKAPKEKKFTIDEVMDLLETGAFTSKDFQDLLSTTENRDVLSGIRVRLDKLMMDHNVSGTARSDFDDFVTSLRTSLSDSQVEKLTPGKKKVADFSKCTFGQTRVIHAYTETAFRLINRYLGGSFKARGVTFPDSVLHLINASIDTLNEGIANIENLNTKGETVYRGYLTSQHSAEKSKYQHMLEKAAQYMMNIGNTTTLGTITSTAYRDTPFGSKEERILYKINNSHNIGKLIEDISYFPFEREVLFPTTAEFRVKSVQGGQESKMYDGQEAKFFIEMDSII